MSDIPSLQKAVQNVLPFLICLWKPPLQPFGNRRVKPPVKGRTPVTFTFQNHKPETDKLQYAGTYNIPVVITLANPIAYELY